MSGRRGGGGILKQLLSVISRALSLAEKHKGKGHGSRGHGRKPPRR